MNPQAERDDSSGMAPAAERLQALAERVRKLGGPDEPDVEPRSEAMPRSNEPTAEFARSDKAGSAEQIAKSATRPATHVNLYVGAADEEPRSIKGIAGLTAELYPEAMAQASKDGRSLDEAACEVLGLGARAARTLSDGDPWMGGRTAWLSPAEIATAIEKAAEQTAEQTPGDELWGHIDRVELVARAVNDDHDAYLRELAYERVGSGAESREEFEADAHGIARELAEAFGVRHVGADAMVANDAMIGRGSVVADGATIESGARIGDNALVGAGAHVRARATIDDEGTVGEGSTIGEGASVHRVEKNCTIGNGVAAATSVLANSRIGHNSRVTQPFGPNSRCGSDCRIDMTVDDLVRIGDCCELANRRGRTEDDFVLQPSWGPRDSVAGGSTIGDDVKAPRGWKPSGPVQVGHEAVIATELRLPSEARIPSGSYIGDYTDLRDVIAETGDEPQIHPTATVHAGARIEPGCTVGEHAEIGAGAHVGAGSTVGAGARIEQGAEIGACGRVGEDAQIEPGARIGAGAIIDAKAKIRSTARIGDSVTINGGAEIAGRVDDGSRVEPGATVERDAHASEECVLRSNAGCRAPRASKRR